jgi:hypothetical protein
MAIEPHKGPPQAGSQPATTPQTRVSPGMVARGGKVVPHGNPLPTFLPWFPPRARPAPPTTWAALARGTDSSPSNVHLWPDSPNPGAGSEVGGDTT